VNSVTPGSLGREVFVVHGRNKAARQEFFSFLRAIDLKPIEWNEALARAGGGAPYIGDVLDKLIRGQHAVIVLLTPDDVVYLDPAHADDENDRDLRPSGQARPNVLFEAGMAMGRCPELTVLVEFGKVRSFTDFDGRFRVKLDGSPESRNQLAQRLLAIGCAVNLTSKDWYREGDLTPPTLSVAPRPQIVATKETSVGVPSGDGPNVEIRTGIHPVTIDRVHVVKGRADWLTIHGDITNNGEHTLTIYLTGTLYGEGRKPLDSALTVVQDLAHGDTMAFEMSAPRGAESCRTVLVQIKQVS